MPIDPRIPLGVQPAQFESPLQTLTSLAQLQQVRDQTEARRLAAEKARRDAADDAAIRTILTETGGDIEAALPRLRTIAPAAALKFETEIGNQRKAGFEALKSQTELRQQRLKLGLQIADSITDETSFQVARPLIAAMSPEIAQAMGEQYDPAIVRQFRDMGLTAKEKIDRQNDSLKLFTEGKAAEGLGTWLSTADSAEAWNGAKQRALDFGVPAAIVAQFGEWGPGAPARAAALAITPEKRATLAGQAEARALTAAGQAQTAAHQAVTEAQGAERIRLARQRLAQGTGGGQDREALMQAVIENPGLWDQITPTERGKIAGELNQRGFTGFGKPLSDAAVKQISDTQSAVESLRDLREVVKKNEQYVGPIAGLAALNPYSEARKAQADIDRVRQRVGKAMEGGVLRKEDEEKYKRILATLTDVPETAVYKIDQLMQDLERDINNYKHQQRLAGRRVPQNAPPAGGTPKRTVGRFEIVEER